MVTAELRISEEQWHSSGDVTVRGNVFRNGKHLGTDVECLFDDVRNPNAFQGALNDLNGQFAVVVDTPQSVYAAVDHIASIPLFYGIGNTTIYIGDDLIRMKETLPDEPCDQDAATEFLLTGYVTGNETLYPRIKQLQPGQMLSVDRATSNGPSVRQYYSFTDQEIVSERPRTLLDRLDTVLTNAFERLVQRAGGDPIVLSFSGGYDSRLSALMLDRVGYENVYAFTFPDFVTEGDLDVAREVAPEFEFEWSPLKLTERNFREFSRSDEYDHLKRTIEDYATVSPYLLWMIVLEKLKRSPEFPDSGVVVTGHDIAGPTRDLPPYGDGTTTLDAEAVVDWIWTRHYSIRHLDDAEIRSTMQNRIRDRLPSSVGDDPEAAMNAIIQWYWQERMPKFLARHARGYHYWGYDRWMPLWDRELADFWGSIPLEHRREKSLYEAYVRELHEEVLGRPCRIAGDEASTRSKSDVLSALDSIVDHLPIESTIRGLFRRRQMRNVMNSSDYGRFGFLSPGQFETLYPVSRHAKYFHALDKLSRIGCYPPPDSPLYEDVRLYESRF
jgi:asparagine synthase (glutamine-hydrolysing)